MDVIAVQRGQNLLDIALQYYGSSEGLEYLLFDNPGVIPHDVTEGDELKIRKDEYKDKDVVLYYQKRNYTPTNG